MTNDIRGETVRAELSFKILPQQFINQGGFVNLRIRVELLVKLPLQVKHYVSCLIAEALTHEYTPYTHEGEAGNHNSRNTNQGAEVIAGCVAAFYS